MTKQSSQNSQIFATGGGTIYYLNNAVKQAYHRRLLTPNSSNITVYAYGSAYTTTGGDDSYVVVSECIGRVTSIDLKVKDNTTLGDDCAKDTHTINGNTTIRLSDHSGVGKLAIKNDEG